MTKFIYRGIYYPVFGNAVGWENGKYKSVISRRIGGYGENYNKWWTFSWGIKCKISNTKKPYRQLVIDAIEIHPEMKIDKEYYDYEDASKLTVPNANSFTMFVVRTNKDEHIGNIESAYFITNLNDLRTYGGDSNQVCRGWDAKKQKAFGWSHRAKVGFGKGDKIYDEKYGDEKTLFTEHGDKKIETYKDAMQSALNFAESVA